MRPPTERFIFMDKFDVAKRVLGLLAQLGAGKITHTIIKNNVDVDKPADKVTVAVGSYALGGVVARAARNQIGEQVDEVRAAYNKHIKKNPPKE